MPESRDNIPAFLILLLDKSLVWWHNFIQILRRRFENEKSLFDRSYGIYGAVFGFCGRINTKAFFARKDRFGPLLVIQPSTRV
jgi:hypothetical protein